MDRPDGLLDVGALGAADSGRPRSAEAHRHDPPAVHPQRLALTNQLSLRRAPAAVALGDAVVAFMPAGLGSVDAIAIPSAKRVTFFFGLDGRPLVLHMTSGLYERMLARIDPELLAADIDAELLPLLLESCIEDGLAAAEAGLRGRIELAAAEKGVTVNLDGPDIALDVSIDGKHAGVAVLRAGIDEVRRLADLWAARPRPRRSCSDLVVELSLRARAIWLDLEALRTLKIGDVLLADDDASRWDRMAATAGEHWLFPIEMSRGQPTLLGPLRRADSRDQEEWMMVDNSHADDEDELSGLLNDAQRRRPDQARGPVDGVSDSEAAAGDPAAGDAGQRPDAGIGIGAPPADAAFDDLPIKLVFELGRLELPIGQLQQIGKGHVFQLDRPLGEAVEILAGGRRIGQGEVVRIEDQVGVRIVRLFGQRGA